MTVFASQTLRASLVILALALQPAVAIGDDCGTEVAGGIIVGQTWTSSGSPYCIDGDIQVAELTIESGVDVVFRGDYVFEVTGVLTAVGAPGDSIRFFRPDTVSSWEGIFFNETTYLSELSYCIIEGAGNSGLRIQESIPPTIDDCAFRNNTGSSGGAISLTIDDLGTTTFTLARCVFHDNESPGHGGALHLNGTATQTEISACSFTGNTANANETNGNYVGGAIYLQAGSMAVSETLFESNRSNARCSDTFSCGVLARGGAIYVGTNGLTVSFKNCEFFDNRAYARNSGNCFFGGTTESYGGGVYVSAGKVSISNCIFANQRNACSNCCGMTLRGGAVYVKGGETHLINCTIVDNNDATALYRSGGTLDVLNCIVYFNNSEGTQIGGAATVDYSCVQGGISGQGNIVGNPNLNDEYRSVFGPCIDGGNPAPEYNDLCPADPGDDPRNDLGAYGGPGACGWLDDPGDIRPVAPRDLAAGVTAGDVNLTWARSEEDDLLEYRLYRDTETAPTTQLATIAAGTETYTDSDVVADTFYYYRLTAVDLAEQESYYSSEVVAKAGDVTPPTAPTGLTAEADDGYVRLAWTANSEPDLTGYRVYRDTQPEPTSVLDSVSAGTEVYHDSSVVNATTYYYRLTAVDDGGNESSYSDTISAYPDIARADLFVEWNPDSLTLDTGMAYSVRAQAGNLGPKAASGVAVAVSLPTGLSADIEAQSGEYDSETGTWSIDSLAVGAVAELEVVVRADSSGLFTCSAQVSASDQPDPNASNNSATLEIRTRDTDLQLEMSVDQPQPIAGESITYQLRLTNAGPSDAAEIAVADTLPAGLTFQGATASQGSYSQPTGVWSTGDLAIGQTATLSLAARVDSLGLITNRAWITGSSLPDPDATSDSTQVIVNCSWADLGLVCTASDTLPAVGSAIDLAVIIQNSGPDAAEGIQVLCEAPSGINFTSVDPSAGDYDAVSGVWSLTELAVGDADTLDISASIDAAGDLPWTAEITASSLRDSEADDDRVVTTISGQAADLAVAKEVDDAFPDPEEEIVFTVTVTNRGPSTATGITVFDALPTGLALDSSSATQGSYSSGNSQWDVGDLTDGSSATLTMDVTVAEAGVFLNQAYALSGSLPDLVSTNDSSAVVINSERADLALTLAVDEPQPDLNEAVLLTVTLTNNGPDEATGVAVTGASPAGLSFSTRSTSLGSVSDDVWTVGTLAASGTATWLIDATVTSEALITASVEVSASEQPDRNTSNNNASVTIDSRPNQPPAIAHTVSSSAWPVGEAATVTATITDEGDVAAATLYYRTGGESSYAEITMTHGTGHSYAATVPASAVTSRGVLYYMTATDEEPLTGTSDVYSAPVAVTNLVNSEAQPAGSEQTAYRLVSFPLSLTNPTPASVLGDDLGAYNKCRWRFFELIDGQDYVEHPETGDIAPGQGYWLIVNEAGHTLDTGAGAVVTLTEAFSIDLEAGWTFIGNPFSFPISQASVRRSSGESLDIRKYAGSWSVHGDSLYPFDGYAVFTTEADHLLIDPTEEALRPMAVANPHGPQATWEITIVASVQQARDTDNAAVVAATARTGWDELDRVEAPVIGQYVSVSFLPTERASTDPAYQLCVDARPEPSDGVVWDIEARTNIDDYVQLAFDGLHDIPSEFEVRLVDPRMSISQDLRMESIYALAPYAENALGYRLQLVVGTTAFLESGYDSALPDPLDYELAPPVPNPSHGLAALRFDLPQAERVTLEIYNVAGEIVATLIPGETRGAGRHASVWDGRDRAGRRVAPGVYFYTLRVADRGVIACRKLALVR